MPDWPEDQRLLEREPSHLDLLGQYDDDGGKNRMTELEKAQAAQAAFRQSMQNGHPCLPGVVFIENPGLDLLIEAALKDWVHTNTVAEQSKPAKRVSLTEEY